MINIQNNNVISISSWNKQSKIEKKSIEIQNYYQSLNFQQLIEETNSLIKTLQVENLEVWPLHKGKLLLEELTNRSSSNSSINELKNNISVRINKLSTSL